MVSSFCSSLLQLDNIILLVTFFVSISGYQSITFLDLASSLVGESEDSVFEL